MKRLALVPLLAIALACPGEKKNQQSATLPVDTTKVDTTTVDTTKTTDLSKVSSNIPKEVPDTFHKQKLRPSGTHELEAASAGSYPDAPSPLYDAVQREQSVTRFCYQEFGQKSDPSLRGNVAMVVTVGPGGVTAAKVGDSRWTGRAGTAVDRCLNERVRQAWKVAPGAVKPGTYVVQLSFTGQ